MNSGRGSGRASEPPGAKARYLVIAGEGSGDLLASGVVARLGATAFGFGGPLLAAAGAELVADFRTTTSMGFHAAAARAPALARALVAVLRAARRERPSAALLVGLSEVNSRLAVLLRRAGVRVLWYAPPQVWAWRPGRAPSIARACDALALVLPFELAHWQRAGARATYVGHPALEAARAASTEASTSVAVLPGSRPHEVRAHLPVLARAAAALARRTGVRAVVVEAPSLDIRTARWLRETAQRAGLAATAEGLPAALRGATCALSVSGTATLECAVLGVPPVIVYRTDPVTYAVARHLVRVPFIGLPNLVLGRPAFPELVQEAFTAEAVTRTALDVLASPAFHRRACADTRAVMEAGLDDRTPSERVAAILARWLP